MALLLGGDTFRRWAILAVLGVNEALLLLGLVLYPAALGEGGLDGIVAATAILAVYGFLALGSPIAVGQADPVLIRGGLILGLAGGTAFSLDLVGAYRIAHNANTNADTSVLAYGFALLLLVGGGIWGAARTGRFEAGVTTALWCVLGALLIWFGVTFASYYLFASTPSGAAFIRLEMAEDFARRGGGDYAGFVMADFFGAGFFHLLLGLILATGLGALGAAGGWFISGRGSAARPRTRRAGEEV